MAPCNDTQLTSAFSGRAARAPRAADTGRSPLGRRPLGEDFGRRSDVLKRAKVIRLTVAVMAAVVALIPPLAADADRLPPCILGPMAPETREATMVEFFTVGNCVWLLLTLVWSLVYAVGVCADNWPPAEPKGPRHIFFRVWWWWSHLVFNFLGAVIGWVMLYFLWYSPKISDFKVEHFVALVIAFLGITGRLPQIVMRLRGPDV
jgi:hypothetical protein